jgi:hypothetical protein
MSVTALSIELDCSSDRRYENIDNSSFFWSLITDFWRDIDVVNIKSTRYERV